MKSMGWFTGLNQKALYIVAKALRSEGMPATGSHDDDHLIL